MPLNNYILKLKPENIFDVGDQSVHFHSLTMLHKAHCVIPFLKNTVMSQIQ